MNGYSNKAQPYLDSIAHAVFNDQHIRDWLIKDTRHESTYLGARSLHKEQQKKRSKTRQPFYCNYWCYPCDKYKKHEHANACRKQACYGIETDAMFYFESKSGTHRCLAIHLEFKHPDESLITGQAEAYPRRAECWAGSDGYTPKGILKHDDWLTVMVCSDKLLQNNRDNIVTFFDRVICHSEAFSEITSYPKE